VDKKVVWINGWMIRFEGIDYKSLRLI